jgi:hypothetical protein
MHWRMRPVSVIFFPEAIAGTAGAEVVPAEFLWEFHVAVDKLKIKIINTGSEVLTFLDNHEGGATCDEFGPSRYGWPRARL